MIRPVGLSDRQLAIIQQAAAPISMEKRGIFLQRVSAMLELRKKFNDDDVADCAALAKRGLVQHRNDAA